METSAGKDEFVPVSEITVRKEKIDTDNLADLAALEEETLEETPAVVDILTERYASGSPYTYIASTLLYVHQPALLSGQDMARVREAYQTARYVSDLPPHLFSLLETSYRSMRMERESQSVVLTGDRGSGKSTLAAQSLR